MKCVLILFICVCCVVFHRCTGEESSVSPVSGFIGLNSLRRKAVLIYSGREALGELRVLPSMNFSCSGTISRWIFVALSRGGRRRNLYPRFQLWRPNRGRYERVYQSSTDSSRFMTADSSIAEYVPPAPIPFEPGYVLGVYQPGDSRNSRLSVIHVSVPTNFSHVNFNVRGAADVTVLDTTASGVFAANDFPLVAVNTTAPQCVQGFLNEEALRIAADVYATDNTYNVRTHERQQRIIPGIRFTCTGMLTKWIIGAQRTLTQSTNYPQLQIWRRSGSSNNLFDRINFSDITDLNATDDLNVYEYVPTPPLQFQTNDLLGLFQPESADTQVYYQEGGGPQNYESGVDSALSRFTRSRRGGEVDRDVPLVAVEVNVLGGRLSAGDCTEEFISRERLVEEALLIGDFSCTYSQQTIIPDINFTTSGSVMRLTFAAQYNASATQYPEVQVWRNMTGTFVKVGNTSNTEPIQTAYLNVYEYVLDPPLPVLAGDVLGICQPPEDESRVHLTFLEDTGPVNWYRDSVTGPLDTFVIDTQSQRNMLPLVAVTFEPDEISEITATPETTSALAIDISPPIQSPTRFSLSTSSILSPPPTTTLAATTLATTTLATTTLATTTLATTTLATTTPGAMRPVENSTPLTTPSLPISTPGAIPPVENSTPLITSSQPISTPGAMPPVEHSSTLITSSPPTSISGVMPPVEHTPTPSLLPTPGTDNSAARGSPAGAIAGALVGVMFAVVVTVLVVLLVVQMLRRRQKKNLHTVNAEERVLNNPVYAAGSGNYCYATVSEKLESVSHDYHTLEPNISSMENQPQYEVPAPQQRNVYSTLDPSNDMYETGKMRGYAAYYNWGVYVPTEGDRRALVTAESIYSTLSESQYASVGPDATFFEESSIYWSPSSDSGELYQQLADRKYREIFRHQIQITEHLGSGQFGTVNKGIWQSPAGAMEAAVKTLQSSASQEDRVKFLQEAAINGQFRHPNVVKLLGVVTVGEPVMIVLELLTNGDLRSYLIKQRPASPGELVPSYIPKVLLGFCKDIASGMECLAGKCFVHRDLAARNILVAGDKTCKIADFGMSRDLADESYYVSHGGKIPVKWTAPEALHFKKYSTASDVWSYGAVMYEIWSIGHKPFEGYSNSQAMKLVERGYRLPPPPGCPKAMYELMIKCWNGEKTSRPAFAELVQALSYPVTDLLSWTEEDTRVHPQAAVLGAHLEAGKDLYPELQEKYSHT